MGAGSIGAVPARVAELGGVASVRSDRYTREGRAL